MDPSRVPCKVETTNITSLVLSPRQSPKAIDSCLSTSWGLCANSPFSASVVRHLCSSLAFAHLCTHDIGIVLQDTLPPRLFALHLACLRPLPEDPVINSFIVLSPTPPISVHCASISCRRSRDPRTYAQPTVVLDRSHTATPSQSYW